MLSVTSSNDTLCWSKGLIPFAFATADGCPLLLWRPHESTGVGERLGKRFAPAAVRRRTEIGCGYMKAISGSPGMSGWNRITAFLSQMAELRDILSPAA